MADPVEMDCHVGHSGEIAKKLSLHVNDTHFTCNSTGCRHGEFNLHLDDPVTERITAWGIVANDPDTSNLASAISGSHTVNDKISPSATFRRDEALAHNCGDAGVAYALNETRSVARRYSGTKDSDNLVALTVSKDFTLSLRPCAFGPGEQQKM